MDEMCSRLEKVSEVALPGNHAKNLSGFLKTNFNSIVLLVGLGTLSSPYALQRSGWMGVIVNLLVALCYLRATWFMFMCQKKHDELLNYQDIAYKTLPRKGRVLLLIWFYLETLGTLVGFSISIVDNLTYIFPDPNIGFLHLRGRVFFIIISSLLILPTTWIQNLSTISFLSFSCIICFIITIICLVWIALTDVGFHQTIPTIKLGGIPAATGIFAFSYGGTGVFPTVYSSMKDKSRFPMVLMISFSIAIVCYSILGIIGVLMFGDFIKPQVTLNMPKHLIASKVAIWATVVTPITKFALLLAPIALEMEDSLLEHFLVDKKSRSALAMSTALRSMLLVATVLVASFSANFGAVIELVGSSMTAIICMILPCIFYRRTYQHDLTKIQVIEVYALIMVSIVAGVLGTLVSIQGLLEKK